jgi:hypothetical protein
MAEVYKSTLAGETTQHFLQFLVMFKQQSLLALGRHPHPPAGAPPPNLALAKAFLQHLNAIRERSRGNLLPEEENFFDQTLAELEQHYQEVTAAQ